MEINKRSIDDMWKSYSDLLLSTNRQGMKELVNWLDNSDFKVAPASTRYHNSFEGGLLEHSLNVYSELLRHQDLIKLLNIPRDSLVITALLHDICKVNFYKMDMRNVKKNGTWVQEPYYTVDDFFPIGHAEKSVIIAQQFIRLTDVEIAMIRNHMGCSADVQGIFNNSNLFDKYPESLLLHMADMRATYILESPGLLEDFKDGLANYMINK